MEKEQICDQLCIEIFSQIRGDALHHLNSIDFGNVNNLSEEDILKIKKYLNHQMEDFFIEQIRGLKDKYYNYTICGVQHMENMVCDSRFKCGNLTNEKG